MVKYKDFENLLAASLPRVAENRSLNDAYTFLSDANILHTQ